MIDPTLAGGRQTWSWRSERRPGVSRPCAVFGELRDSSGQTPRWRPRFSATMRSVHKAARPAGDLMARSHLVAHVMRQLVAAAACAFAAAGCTHDFSQFEPRSDAALVSSQDGGDAAGSNDGAPADTSGGGVDGACSASCTAQAKSCAGACTQTSASCTAQCPTGNAGKGCRQQCQTQETQCRQGCATSCTTCSSGLGCSDPAGCTAATQ
jgi:hypothetical protein